MSLLNAKLPFSANASTPWAAGFAIVLFCLCFTLSQLIPPFQSPDEDVHVKRAYLLGHGQIWLSTPAQSPTGGLIDQGLLQLMGQFEGLPFHAEKKLSANELYESGQVRWQGSYTFHPTSAPSHYFPLLYTPQALGLRIGELLNLSVLHSYELAKLFALLAGCALIYWALLIYPFSLAVLGLFVLPMSIFQMGSASLDGIAHAMSFFVIALYLRISQQSSTKQTTGGAFNSAPWQGILLALCIALLTSSRMQLLPLLFLLWSCSNQTRQKKYLYYAAAVGIFTLTWILLSIATVVDIKVPTSLTPIQAISFYLAHPITGVQVLFSTLTNLAILKSYATSFIGVLGWLDASLPKAQYGLLGALLVLLMALSFSWRPQGLSKHHQSVLVLCAVSSMGIVFAALLIQWTPHPATVILGVQGRYFFVPALLIGVAFTRPFVHLLNNVSTEPSASQKTPKTTLAQTWTQKMSLAVLILLSGSALYCTSHLLLGRYYLMPEQADVSQWRPVSISASRQDDKSSYLPVVFSPYQTQQPARLQSISLLLDVTPTSGNQAQTSQSITLQLWNAQGLERQLAASTSATAASGYLTINVPQDAYTKGQIIVSKELALRMKGVQHSNGEQRACIIYELSDGSRRYTPGCP
jgi:uncharacterized membrane protein